MEMGWTRLTDESRFRDGMRVHPISVRIDPRRVHAMLAPQVGAESPAGPHARLVFLHPDLGRLVEWSPRTDMVRPYPERSINAMHLDEDHAIASTPDGLVLTTLANGAGRPPSCSRPSAAQLRVTGFATSDDERRRSGGGGDELGGVEFSVSESRAAPAWRSASSRRSLSWLSASSFLQCASRISSSASRASRVILRAWRPQGVEDVVLRAWRQPSWRQPSSASSWRRSAPSRLWHATWKRFNVSTFRNRTFNLQPSNQLKPASKRAFNVQRAF